jgi:hypothetical protein
MRLFLEATHDMFEGGEDVPVYRPQPRPESAPAGAAIAAQPALQAAGGISRWVVFAS